MCSLRQMGLLGEESGLTSQGSHKAVGLYIFAAISAIILVSIAVLNQWMLNQIEPPTPSRPEEAAPQPQSSLIKKLEYVMEQELATTFSTDDKDALNTVIRKTRVIRGNDFTETTFSAGGHIVATQNCYSEDNCETTGSIPDGLVKFYDYYKGTSGEEYYRDGKRHGAMTTYAPDGRILSEAYYMYGMLSFQKEYYNDGKLRFEVNYEDAKDTGDKREVGIGKLYYPNGNLKFEWNLTNGQRIGYKKSYNYDGVLRHVAYYDEWGQLIENEGKEGEGE